VIVVVAAFVYFVEKKPTDHKFGYIFGLAWLVIVPQKSNFLANQATSLREICVHWVKEYASKRSWTVRSTEGSLAQKWIDDRTTLKSLLSLRCARIVVCPHHIV
jgi:hypothetical protein